MVKLILMDYLSLQPATVLNFWAAPSSCSIHLGVFFIPISLLLLWYRNDQWLTTIKKKAISNCFAFNYLSLLAIEADLSLLLSQKTCASCISTYNVEEWFKRHKESVYMKSGQGNLYIILSVSHYYCKWFGLMFDLKSNKYGMDNC